jgi:hypothetical protein
MQLQYQRLAALSDGWAASPIAAPEIQDNRKMPVGAIMRGCEAFMLNGCEDSFFSWHEGDPPVKLKKD